MDSGRIEYSKHRIRGGSIALVCALAIGSLLLLLHGGIGNAALGFGIRILLTISFLLFVLWTTASLRNRDFLTAHGSRDFALRWDDLGLTVKSPGRSRHADWAHVAHVRTATLSGRFKITPILQVQLWSNVAGWENWAIPLYSLDVSGVELANAIVRMEAMRAAAI